MPIPLLSIEERYELSRRISNEEKRCFHPDAPSGCSPGGPIKSHTVSKGTSLAGIAENGQVMTIVKPFDDIVFGDTATVKPNGVKVSSVFPGFCKTHDNSLFNSIETGGWIPSKEACFLLSYRSLSNTAFKSRTKIRYFEHMNSIDEARAIAVTQTGFSDDDIANDYDFSIYAQRYLSYKGAPGKNVKINNKVRKQYAEHAIGRALIIGLNPYLKNARSFSENGILTQMKEMWNNRNYDNFRFIALKYDSILPFAASKTIKVRIITDGVEKISHTNLNVCSNKSEAYIIFGWLEDGGTVKDYLQTSIFGDDAKIANKVLSYLLKNPTNLYFQNSWWNSLPDEVRNVALAYHSKELNAFPEKIEVADDYKAILSEFAPAARLEG